MFALSFPRLCAQKLSLSGGQSFTITTHETRLEALSVFPATLEAATDEEHGPAVMRMVCLWRAVWWLPMPYDWAMVGKTFFDRV